MKFLEELYQNIFILLNAMSIYILLGLILAGILKQIVPSNFISKHLGKKSFSSIIKATIFGIPLPVCSCSVIPLAKSLQKEGASKGAVQSFLISTPITGVDSILATYSFFGFFFTLYRVISSIIIAILVGLIENFLNREDIKKPKFNLKNQKIKVNREINFIQNSTCKSSCCTTNSNKGIFSIAKVFDYAFNTLFKDIAKSLFFGVIFGALFTTFLPKELLSNLNEYKLLSYFLVLVIALPLYVCATSSLPIAASFVLSGMSIGSAFIFLSAGPATNSITMSVVAQMFGKRSLLVYVGVISLFSIFFGFLLDFFSVNIISFDFKMHMQDYSILDITASIIMVALMLYYMIRR
jgi:uncharacterized membrane protein YraQ (UPF0718 family)